MSLEEQRERSHGQRQAVTAHGGHRSLAQLGTSPDQGQGQPQAAHLTDQAAGGGPASSFWLLSPTECFRDSRGGCPGWVREVPRELGCTPGTPIPPAEAEVTPTKSPTPGEWHHPPLHRAALGKAWHSSRSLSWGRSPRRLRTLTAACSPGRQVRPRGGRTCVCW